MVKVGSTLHFVPTGAAPSLVPSVAPPHAPLERSQPLDSQPVTSRPATQSEASLFKKHSNFGDTSPTAIDRMRNTPIHCIQDMQTYMYYGDASVPGITNLVFSIMNITSAMTFIVRGFFGAGELLRDGALKLGAALLTLAHAVMTLGLMLSPYIDKIASLIDQGGPALQQFIRVGGIVIAGLEMIVKGWNIVRQCLFERRFSFKDLFDTSFDFDKYKDSERALQDWSRNISKNLPKIFKLFGNSKANEFIGEIGALHSLTYTHGVTKQELKELQQRLKIAQCNRNFEILHKEYFDISSDEDQAYIASFGDTREQIERGIGQLTNYKLIRAYRRMPCPSVASKVNEFVIQRSNYVREFGGQLVDQTNIDYALDLFSKIETKSSHVKIAYAVGLVGLALVAAAFIITTSGFGAIPFLFPVVFWSGWTITFIGGVLESCWVRSAHDRIDLRYLLPNPLRKRWCDKDVHDESLPGRVTDLRGTSEAQIMRAKKRIFETKVRVEEAIASALSIERHFHPFT